MAPTTDHFESTFFQLESRGEIALLRSRRSSLSDEDNVEQFGRELFHLVDQLGYLRIVLSLQGVNWISSSIIGKLIHLHRHLKRNQGELALCDLNHHVEDVMITSRLNTYFMITTTAEQAIARWKTSA